MHAVRPLNRLVPALAVGIFALSGLPDPALAQEDPRPAVVERIRRMDLAGVPVPGRLANAAADFVRASAAAPGVDRSRWKVRSVTRGADGLDHVRLDQLHGGVRVWGADVVVHASATDLRGVNGTFVRGLDGVATTPALSDKGALAIAQADYAAAVPNGGPALAYERESTELVILPLDGKPARLAWHAVFFTEQQGGLAPGWWHYFVDAQDGQVLKKLNAIDTLSQASGPGGNARVARQWVSQLDVEPSGSVFKMSTARLLTTNMKKGTSGGGTLVTGPLNPIGDAPINDAHGFTEITLNMLGQWMGLNSIDDAGMIIKSRVHYDVGFDNAFWDGTRMTYGDGGVKFLPLSGDVDVVAHEINHGFTQFHSGLIYENQPGGLNESFSDVAGTVAEFFNEGAAADFDIGRDVMQAGGALRFMCNPTADGTSIDHASSYHDGLDPHFSSGVMNKAFCRAARRLSSGSPTGAATPAGVRRAGQAWFMANAGFWTQSTDFFQACQGLLDAARFLSFAPQQVEAIRQSWVDVGVVCEVPKPAPADYDGDGRTDLAVKDGGGVWKIDYAGNGFGAWDEVHPGYGPTSVPVPADYDGDHKADISVKGTDGIWYIDYASNGFGAWDAVYPGYGPTSVPVPADYDGDGRADLSVKGSSDGIWYIDYASNGFGAWDASFLGYGTTSVPVPADYDGDTRADLSVKGTSDGIWYIDHAVNGFGAWDVSFLGYGPTSRPVPADYDADRKADLSVTDAAVTTWFIDFAAGGFGAWNQIIALR